MEYEYAFTPDWFARGGYIRSDFDRPGLKWQFLNGTQDDFYDIYGDGTLTTIFTPGTRRDISRSLSGCPRTAYPAHHRRRLHARSLGREGSAGFLASTVDTVRSVRKLHAVADRTGALVVTGHDPEAWPSFRKAPLFYA